MKYLTDEELMNLIDSVKDDEIIQAPPEIMDKVIEGLDSNEKIIDIHHNHDIQMQEINSGNFIKSYDDKVREFRGYKMRVFLAMAASIILCLLSQIGNFNANISEDYSILAVRNSREKITEYRTKQEVIEENKSIYQKIKESELLANIPNVED